MYKIQDMIESYLLRHSVRQLQQATGVGAGTIYAIRQNHKGKKYTKQTLDSLYGFFCLDKDGFYKENLKIYSYKNALGLLFRLKREQLGLSKHQIAKKIKGSERHLTRIETGDSSYRASNYYVDQLLRLYPFSQVEKRQIMAYLQAIKDINELVKANKCPGLEQ